MQPASSKPGRWVPPSSRLVLGSGGPRSRTAAPGRRRSAWTRRESTAACSSPATACTARWSLPGAEDGEAFAPLMLVADRRSGRRSRPPKRVAAPRTRAPSAVPTDRCRLGAQGGWLQGGEPVQLVTDRGRLPLVRGLAVVVLHRRLGLQQLCHQRHHRHLRCVLPPGRSQQHQGGTTGLRHPAVAAPGPPVLRRPGDHRRRVPQHQTVDRVRGRHRREHRGQIPGRPRPPLPVRRRGHRQPGREPLQVPLSHLQCPRRDRPGLTARYRRRLRPERRLPLRRSRRHRRRRSPPPLSTTPSGWPGAPACWAIIGAWPLPA